MTELQTNTGDTDWVFYKAKTKLILWLIDSCLNWEAGQYVCTGRQKQFARERETREGNPANPRRLLPCEPQRDAPDWFIIRGSKDTSSSCFEVLKSRWWSCSNGEPTAERKRSPKHWPWPWWECEQKGRKDLMWFGERGSCSHFGRF